MPYLSPEYIRIVAEYIDDSWTDDFDDDRIPLEALYEVGDVLRFVPRYENFNRPVEQKRYVIVGKDYHDGDLVADIEDGDSDGDKDEVEASMMKAVTIGSKSTEKAKQEFKVAGVLQKYPGRAFLKNFWCLMAASRMMRTMRTMGTVGA